MGYFLINILKIAVSARCSIIIHQTSAFVILMTEISLYKSAIFVSGGARFGFISRRRYPRYATDTQHCWFLKGVELYRA